MDAGPAHRTNEPAGVEDGASLYFGQATPFRIFQLMKLAPHPREITRLVMFIGDSFSLLQLIFGNLNRSRGRVLSRLDWK
jgi:hypothetical protein